jgi:hypothetical protein
MNDKPVIAVWFSCGAASAVALKVTLEKYSDTHTVRVINNPIIEEGTDNRRFLNDVANWLNVDIELAIHPKYPKCSAVEVWDKARAMSFPNGAPCTKILKREARQHWERGNKHDYIVMGFTLEERARSDRFRLTERSNLLPVLIDAGITKEDCFRTIEGAGIKLPEPYLRGMPNANCIGCPKATSPTYWNHIRTEYPETFIERSVQSRRLGVKLVRVKGQRVFLDDLSPLAKGRKMANYQPPSCSLFCEE